VNPSSLTTLFHEWKRTDAAQEVLSNIPWLKEALLKTNMNAGILIAVAVALIASMVISRTKLGYELRAVGLNKEAAKFSGINVNRSIITSMGIAGAICGLSGALTVTGIAPYAISTMAGQDGSGFNGLSVAFMAGCSPIGCIPASILFSLLLYGGVSVQQAIGTPSEIINIMIGTIVFCMALPGIGPAIADALKRKRLEKENGTATLDAGSEG
jgi:simple sugar transport system permease protein